MKLIQMFEHSDRKEISDSERSLLMRIWQSGLPAKSDLRAKAAAFLETDLKECLVLDEAFLLAIVEQREVVFSLSA